ncbi:MAG: autotransporter outer membrane beta-barrel domain-containing protein [Magnetococcales bacterium]|nr:autotransporter outer membrane beta-barrel domain-containing protein [Magnetococcales bacterium]
MRNPLGLIRPAMIGGTLVLSTSGAFAASDVSNSGDPSRQSTSSIVTPMSSMQTSGLISNAVAGGFVPSSGGGGGFVPSGGGGGGFVPSGGGGAPQTPQGGAPTLESPQITPGEAPTLNIDAPGPLTGLPSSFTTRGMSAGGKAAPYGVWGQGTFAKLDRSETGLETDGNLGHYILGGDFKFSPRLLMGAAVSWETMDLDTPYNQGTFEGSGLTITPYLGLTINETWTADFSLGYGWLNYDTTRNSGTITGGFDAERLSLGANLVGVFAKDQWKFQPKVGVVYVNETQEAYQETGGGTYSPEDHVEFGRLTAGTKIGYALENSIPYLKLMGEWDYLTPNSVLKSGGQYSTVDTFGGVLGLGYEIYKGGFTGSVEVNENALFRNDLNLWSVALRGRYEF